MSDIVERLRRRADLVDQEANGERAIGQTFAAGLCYGHAAELRALADLVEAGRGLALGVDWNNGTMAKEHGYRQRLIDALARLDGEAERRPERSDA